MKRFGFDCGEWWRTILMYRLRLKAGPGLAYLLSDLSSGILTCGGWGQLFAVLLHRFHPFVDNLTELFIDLDLIGSVTARSDNAGTLSNETPVLIGPLDQLDVARTLFH